MLKTLFINEPSEYKEAFTPYLWGAMTSDRIYKKATTFEEAKKEMISLKEKQFAPRVVDALLILLKTKQ